MSVQVRKTVTVLFADLVGSTALAEEVDPEALRGSLAAYFEAMRSVLELHGGTVEKFIGDAVMAVFGIPELHEDDALRAVRAAAAMQRRLSELALAVPLQMRIGVTTGEVVAGEGETFATGDAVNVAARLETAAEPGTILLGAETRALVADAVRVERVEPLELKGKSARVPAFRLVEVLPGAPAFTRRFDAPFVGREHELGRLLAELAQARDNRACRLAVVTGDAGIGKSRLVRELVAEAQDGARVVVGRCLSYGDGITYWPLREIVLQVAGAEPREQLIHLLDEQAADAILGAVGLGPVAAQTGEIHWAVRRLLEGLARERPLVVVLDDAHWAEATLLDLVDYLQGFSRDAAILVVATGRPELLDVRPVWRGVALELEPLTESEAVRLVEGLAQALPEDRRARVVSAADGNPLFVEQLLASAGDGDGELAVPPTIQALLAARIDALSPDERSVVECGAVEGRLFHRGAVAALAQHDVMTQLLSLVRRQLVRPDEAEFRGEDAFRFSHALIRDAAYNAASKARRAELHERYARWLERAAGERLDDFEEILAYHVEQAALLGAEIGAPRDDLAHRAGLLLATVGRRALARGDVGATASLLRRAIAVLPPSPERAAVCAEYPYAVFMTGDIAAAQAAVDEVLADPDADDAARARAVVTGCFAGMLTGRLSVAEVRAELEPVVAALQAAGDEPWVVRAFVVLLNTCAMEAVFGPAIDLLRRVFELDRAMDDPELRSQMLFWFGAALMLGPVPVPDALAEIDRVRPRVRTPLDQAWLEFGLAMLLGLAGDLARSRALFATSRAMMRDGGAQIYYAAGSIFAAQTELLAGDAGAAEQMLAEGWELLGAGGERGLRSTVGIYLALARELLGRAGVEALADEAVALAQPDDVSTQFLYRGVLSRVRSREARHDDALGLARESVEIALKSDATWHHIDAQLFLADAAAAAGDDATRRTAAGEALRLIDAHGLEALRTRALALAE